MKNVVTVVIPRNEDGTPKHDLIRVKPASEGGNPEWGSVALESFSLVTKNGVMTKRHRFAYFRGPIEVLQELDLKEGDNINKKLTELGMDNLKIIQVERTEPMYEGHQQKQVPLNSTVNPGEKIFTVDGEPIYMRFEVAAEGEGKSDVLLNAAQAPTTADAMPANNQAAVAKKERGAV